MEKNNTFMAYIADIVLQNHCKVNFAWTSIDRGNLSLGKMKGLILIQGEIMVIF